LEYCVLAPRPYWRGYLKLSLVSCPIALHSACSASERVSFRQVNSKTGNRVRQQLADDETREPVERADIRKGYEFAKNEYMIVEDGEIEAIEIESTKTIEIDSFVPKSQVDQRFLDSPYYISPEGKVGQDAFAVIRDAMRGKRMVALGRVVMNKRERVVMIEPHENGLIATTLRYPYELRDAKNYFEDVDEIKTPKEMIELAEHILDSKTAAFDPATFVDRYESALVEFLKRKQAKLPAPTGKPAPAPANVVNLMDALRRSIATERAPARPAGRRSAAPVKPSPGRSTARVRKAG
jgi:DNA end-binding protein Ku